MPIDYSTYPANWKTEIVPMIRLRSGNKCEQCGVPNGIWIFRGLWENREVFQDADMNVFDCDTGELIPNVEDDIHPFPGKEDAKAIKVVLTVAHLDHDTDNNEPANLKHLCQLHHLRHDVEHHRKSRKETRKNKMGQIEIEL